MRLTVLYFAAAREAAGLAEEALELPPGADLSALAARVAALHPALGPLLPRVRFALDGAFAPPSAPLRDDAEVALIPPVAGGAGPGYRVGPEPVSIEEATAEVAGPDAGGVVTFLGVVRDASHGRDVLRLEYEAYVPMAVRQLAAIGAECAARWPGARVAIHHRTGTLAIGEAAVAIAAAAPHRDEAFAACRHAIERLKEDVPIWKKEHFADGSVWVGLGP